MTLSIQCCTVGGMWKFEAKDVIGETIGRVRIEAGEAELVPFGGFLARSNYTATLRDAPFPVRLGVAVEDGQPKCAAIERASPDVSLTGALLRSLPVERILRETSWMVVYEERLVSRDEWEEYERAPPPAFGEPPVLFPLPIAPGDEPETRDDARFVRMLMTVTGRPGGLEELKALADHRPRRGARISDSLLQDVARVYRAALRSGENPTAAVASAIPVARSTAGRYVSQARARGYLGEALGPRAGERAEPEPPKEETR